MNYFYLSHSTDINTVGEFEQISSESLSVDEIKLFNKIKLNRTSFIDKFPVTLNLNLCPNAIKTDVLSFSHISMNTGFIINSRALEIIEQHSCENYRLHDLKINYLTELYSFINVIEDSNNIDFKNSVFVRSSLLGLDSSKQQLNNINSISDFYNKNIEIQKNLPGSVLCFKKLVLNKKIDLIRLPGNSRILISEELKKEFLTKRISGIDFKLCNIEVELKEYY
ncbi:MAG: hypothetical protein N4A49_09635 [Marinifilaceae bacterium]|jgi:hypothetical protein|nr:hypothetical protein [Marinifilaceae bacterium]